MGFYNDLSLDYTDEDARYDRIDGIPSPIARPRAASLGFAEWLFKLDAICWRKVGCALDDLEDFDTESGYEDGYTPAAFFREVIAPEVGL